MNGGGIHGVLLIPGELLAPDKFWNRGVAVLVVLTSEHTMLQWRVLSPWSYKQSWINPARHKTRQKDRNDVSKFFGMRWVDKVGKEMMGVWVLILFRMHYVQNCQK